MAAMEHNDEHATGQVGSRTGWIFLSLTRIAIGWIFLWAFLDKLFGLGFSTCRQDDGSIQVMCERAWLEGGAVTEGYLASSSGPFADFFIGLADQRWTDWGFMIGLAGVGLALILGIGTRIAAVAGSLLLAMMYVSHAWPNAGGNANNPFMDDHILQILAIIAIVLLERTWQAVGLGNWWRKLSIVQKNRWLV
ncbi:DoxX family protein [Demequina muriae]|uniref:DoxX family protein n=1 Tax=Demequina muriae TaxID=3051664 RepID=A0ABT8GIX3_9MICO|nr:DoxX family protein [Demequina sp. EGI L300058]MDN4481383.1 DoxX family protein [Demequina sp. EGI L300058]